MTRIVFICLFGFICLFNQSYGQQTFLVSRENVSNAEAKTINKRVDEIINKNKNIYNTQSDFLQTYSNLYKLRCLDLELFAKRMLVVNNFVSKISLLDSVLTIYFTPDFYQFSSEEEIFHIYNDYYYTLFSYNEISGISIKLTDGRNLTFLPSYSNDYTCILEGGIMRKKWYFPNMDYIELIGGVREFEKEYHSGKYLNPNNEFKTSVLESLINTYNVLINSD